MLLLHLTLPTIQQQQEIMVILLFQLPMNLDAQQLQDLVMLLLKLR
jgi:hypothetical protein